MSVPALVEIKNILCVLLCNSNARLGRSCMYDFFINPTEHNCNDTSTIEVIYTDVVERNEAANRLLKKYDGKVCYRFESTVAFTIGARTIKLFTDEMFCCMVDFDDLAYDPVADRLEVRRDSIEEASKSLLEVFRKKQCKLSRYHQKWYLLKQGTATVPEKNHLGYYIRNGWRFFHDDREYTIVDFQLIEQPVPSKETPTPVVTATPVAPMSPHVLLVVGTRTITIPTGRELSIAEFERLTEVVKTLTQ